MEGSIVKDHDWGQMTFANFTGRGGGGGGRWSTSTRGGRVGGSHHRATATRGAMSWVRGGNGGRGTTAVGGNQYRGSVTTSKSSIHSKWVRPKAETNAEKESGGDNNVGADAYTHTQQIIRATPQPATSLLQRGPYKLVTRAMGENRGKSRDTNAETTVPTKFEETSKRFRRGGDGSLNNDKPDYSQNLNIVSNHQLELTAEVKNSSDQYVESQDVDKAHPASQNDQRCLDEAKGKDILFASSSNQKIPDRLGDSKPHVSTNNGKLSGGSKKRSLPSSFHSRRPLAQRIKLPNQDLVVEKDRENSGQDSEASDNIPGLKQEKLSDFAYRETGRLVQQGHQNRTWKAGTASTQTEPQSFMVPRKMGLIRAKQVNAPICPFYARGIDCTDQFCRKRHDVPIEAVVPVCSFFQRNGQCFKDECKFRHVKTRSIICPTFALLGYCDTSDCTMKHLRPQHKSSPTQKGLRHKDNRRYEGKS